MKFPATFLSVLALTGLTCAAHATEPSKPVAIPQVSDAWRFSLTPYLWAVNAKADIYYKDRLLSNPEMSTSNMMAKLQFALMAEGEVHKGNWGFAANLLYSRLGDSNANMLGQVNLGSSTTMQMGVYSLTGTYTLYNTNQAYIDGLAGARIFYKGVNTEVNVEGTPRNATLSSNSTSVNPIVGLKGRVRIADSDYFVPFYADVGGGVGGVELTSQVMLGVGRAFNWGDLTLMANNLYYKTKTDQVTTNLDMYGAQLGVTFKF